MNHSFFKLIMLCLAVTDHGFTADDPSSHEPSSGSSVSGEGDVYISQSVSSLYPALMAISAETDHLILRRIIREDLNDEAIEYLFGIDLTDPMDSRSSPQPLPTAEGAYDVIQNLNLQDPLWGILDKKEGCLIGTIGLRTSRRFKQSLELGIELFPKARGKGYGSAAERALFGCVKETVRNNPEWNLNFIDASINFDNVASQKAAISAGMVRYDKATQTGEQPEPIEHIHEGDPICFYYLSLRDK